LPPKLLFVKLKLTCLLLIVLSLKSYSQDTETEVTNVLKATILNPGVAYEAKLGKFQTAYAQFFMNTSSYSWTDYNNEVHMKLYFDPAATLQFRHYYNARKREEKEKRTAMNSMNFVAIVAESFFSKIPLGTSEVDEEKRRAVTQVGACWGLQRNTDSRFSLDLYFGLGLRLSSYTSYDSFADGEKFKFSQGVFMGQINIGFWLGKRPADD
jgi:hypothetical protein